MTRLRASRFAGQARLLIVVPALVLLAGCDPVTLKGSVAGGECKVFERPPYVVVGARPYDQNWIDSQVEGGVGACGWKRPLPRPAAIDAAAPNADPKAAAPKAAPAKKRRGVLARIKAAVHRAPEVPAAVAPAPAAAPDPAPALPEPAPPPPPRSRLDLLLDRSAPFVGRPR